MVSGEERRSEAMEFAKAKKGQEKDVSSLKTSETGQGWAAAIEVVLKHQCPFAMELLNLLRMAAMAPHQSTHIPWLSPVRR